MLWFFCRTAQHDFGGSPGEAETRGRGGLGEGLGPTEDRRVVGRFPQEREGERDIDREREIRSEVGWSGNQTGELNGPNFA